MRSISPRSWAIVTVGLILTGLTAHHEALIVSQIFKNPAVGFRDFMANSLYEGRSFGGSDFGVTMAILAFFLWLKARTNKKTPNSQSYSQLKFIWLTGLLTGICAVHSMKWIISRARPKIILTSDTSEQILANMTWPGFMPLDGPRGIDWNSFPSGHTASCAIMLVYAYLAWPRSRIAGIFIFGSVAFYCGLMAVARSMSGMHWLSDSVASFFLAWLIIDLVAKNLALTSRTPQQGLTSDGR